MQPKALLLYCTTLTWSIDFGYYSLSLKAFCKKLQKILCEKQFIEPKCSHFTGLLLYLKFSFKQAEFSEALKGRGCYQFEVAREVTRRRTLKSCRPRVLGRSPGLGIRGDGGWCGLGAAGSRTLKTDSNLRNGHAFRLRVRARG